MTPKLFTKKEEEKKPDPLVNAAGDPLIGVKTKKLGEGEIEGFDEVIKE